MQLLFYKNINLISRHLLFHRQFLKVSGTLTSSAIPDGTELVVEKKKYL
jgi:hypothetical protein